MDYEELIQEALDQHSIIGFPSLSDDDQCRLLIKKDIRILNNLTPDYRMAALYNEVLTKYITIDKSTLKAYYNTHHLIQDNIELHLQSPDRDGEWVKLQKDGSYNIIFQERGHPTVIKNCDSIDQVIDHYVDDCFRVVG